MVRILSTSPSHPAKSLCTLADLAESFRRLADSVANLAAIGGTVPHHHPCTFCMHTFKCKGLYAFRPFSV